MPARALDFELRTTPEGAPFVLLSGEFLPSDDLQKLEAFVRTNRAVAVSFDSPGGHINKAMAVGRLIRELDLLTFQFRSQDCTSACALAFLGGVYRYAEPGSIGVHKSSFDASASTTVDEAVSAIQQSTSDVIRYISEMGADPALLALSLSYENFDVRYLSGSEMAELKVTTEQPPQQSAATAKAPPSRTPGIQTPRRGEPGVVLTPAEVEGVMQETGLAFLAAVKQELPLEYETLVHALIESAANNESEIEIAQKYAEFAAELQDKYAAQIKNAPDEAILAVLRTNLDFLTIVQRRESSGVCTHFVLWGATILNSNDPEYQRWVDKLEAALVRAFGAALRNPEPVRPPSDADWWEIEAAFTGTPDQFQLVLDRDTTNPGFCKAAILFIEALINSRNASGRRVRVQLAYNVASANRTDPP
jgi:hypothetical protein